MSIVERLIAPAFSVWHMDGGSQYELIQVYGTPCDVMAYDGKHLYFSESLLGIIERIGTDGQNKTIMHFHFGTRVAMDSITMRVYWADLKLHLISSSDYDDGRQQFIWLFPLMFIHCRFDSQQKTDVVVISNDECANVRYLLSIS